MDKAISTVLLITERDWCPNLEILSKTGFPMLMYKPDYDIYVRLSTVILTNVLLPRISHFQVFLIQYMYQF